MHGLELNSRNRTFIAATLLILLLTAITVHAEFKQPQHSTTGYDTKLTSNSYRNLVETQVRKTGQEIVSLFREPVQKDTSVFDPANGSLVLSQEEGTGNWIGAPSVLYDNETDQVLFYSRYRDRFERGHSAAIWSTSEGENFQKIWSIDKTDIEALSLEGAAIGKKDGNYTLFLSYQNASSGNWEVRVFNALRPSGFDIGDSRRLELDTTYRHLKDPVLHDGTLYLYASPWHFMDSANLAVDLSKDRETEEIVFEDDNSPRLTSVSTMAGEKLVFYDWRPSYFHVTEEKTRYGALDGLDVNTLTPSGSAIVSEEGTESVRYVSAEKVRDEVWIFYERSREGGNHQLYMQKMPEETFVQSILEGNR